MLKGKWTLVLILLAIAALFMMGAFKVNQNSAVAEVGQPAPDFTLPDINGANVTLSNLRGQVVIINFWATWCPPCKAEMPDFQRLHTEMGDRVKILAVDRAEPVATVRDFLNKYGITFPVLLDKEDELSRRYGLVGIPETYFVDKKGVIRRKFLGPMTLEQMREFVREAER